MDLAQAREAGVDLDALLVCQPSTVEEALDLSLSLLQTRQVGLLVVDSLALLPLRGQDDPTSHEAIRYGSVLMARSLRVIGETASRTGCAVVFSAKSVDRGAELAAIGSNALRFYSTLRVEFSPTSHGSVARVRKNKLAPLVPTAVRIPRRPARSDEVTAASSLGKMISPSALGSGEPHVLLAP